MFLEVAGMMESPAPAILGYLGATYMHEDTSVLREYEPKLQ